MPDVEIGALCWNQYTYWQSLQEAGIQADRLGYDTIWTWDQRSRASSRVPRPLTARPSELNGPE